MGAPRKRYEAEVGMTVLVKIPGIGKPQPIKLRSESNGRHEGFWGFSHKLGNAIFVPAGEYRVAR